jgi:hypothetical protein
LKASGLDVALWRDSAMISEFAAMLGRHGGSRRNPNKGFGSATPEARRAASIKGLEARWGSARRK